MTRCARAHRQGKGKQESKSLSFFGLSRDDRTARQMLDSLA